MAKSTLADANTNRSADIFRTKKGAFKLHTLLDQNGYLLSFFVLTDGKIHDINVVKHE